MTERLIANAAGGESLEHAHKRTLEFVSLVRSKIAEMGLDPASTEPLVDIVEKISHHLTDPKEHYEVRAQLAGAYCSAAYKYIVKQWTGQVPSDT